MKVGDSVWFSRTHESNRRASITSETSRSWVIHVGRGREYKIPKSFTGARYDTVTRDGYCLSIWLDQVVMERHDWINGHRHRLGQLVDRTTDFNILRQVADLLRYEVPAPFDPENPSRSVTESERSSQ